MPKSKRSSKKRCPRMHKRSPTGTCAFNRHSLAYENQFNGNAYAGCSCIDCKRCKPGFQCVGGQCVRKSWLAVPENRKSVKHLLRKTSRKKTSNKSSSPGRRTSRGTSERRYGDVDRLPFMSMDELVQFQTQLQEIIANETDRQKLASLRRRLEQVVKMIELQNRPESPTR